MFHTYNRGNEAPRPSYGTDFRKGTRARPRSNQRGTKAKKITIRSFGHCSTSRARFRRISTRRIPSLVVSRFSPSSRPLPRSSLSRLANDRVNKGNKFRTVGILLFRPAKKEYLRAARMIIPDRA